MNDSLLRSAGEGEASPALRDLLARIPCGPLPDVLGIAARSPAALEALAAQIEATLRMRLPARLQAAIGLRVAELHGCGACDATPAGIDPGLAERYRRGLSDDVREQAILALTTKVVRDRGRNCGLALDYARHSGVGSAEIVETLVLVGLHTFASYLDLVAREARSRSEAAGGEPRT